MQPLRLTAWTDLVTPRPIAVVDLETTDAEVDTAGVVEFGAVGYSAGKVAAAAAAASAYLSALANGEAPGVLPMPEPDWTYPIRLNPGRPIAPGATAVHGIRDEDVVGCPGIEAIAGALQTIADGYTVVTYNGTKFDLRVLQRLTGFAPRHTIDVLGVWAGTEKIDPPTWHSAEELALREQGRRPGPRVLGQPILDGGRDVLRDRLGAAHYGLLGRRLVGAHGAVADCEGTARVLFAALALYTTLPTDPDALGAWAAEVIAFVRRDADGAAYFTRGKMEGQRVIDVYTVDPGYVGWALCAGDLLAPEKALIVDTIGEANADRLVARHMNKTARDGGGRGRRAS